MIRLSMVKTDGAASVFAVKIIPPSDLGVAPSIELNLKASSWFS